MAKYVWAKLTPQERNALIAEHVFDHNVRTSENGMPYKLVHNEFTEEEYSMAINNYTTDIKEAMRVAEKMDEDGYWFRFEYSSDWHPARGEVVFGGKDGGTGINITPEMSKPEAICLAALKAKGVDIE